MRIMTKLATVLRGGVRESAEAVIDANGLRIFAQEIQDCETNINHSKQQLAGIIADKISVKRDLDALLQRKQRQEQHITQCLEEHKEAEALTIAERIAEQQTNISRQQQHYQQLSEYADSLQQSLQKMAQRLCAYRSEYHMLQATDNMQSVQRKFSSHSNNSVSHYTDMQDSLSRIKQRQQRFSDNMKAMDQVEASLDNTNLDDDHDSPTAHDILDALRQ